MQGTQYATKRSILCRGAFCGPTPHVDCMGPPLPTACRVKTLFRLGGCPGGSLTSLGISSD